MRLDRVPHSGQARSLPSARAQTTIASPLAALLSMTNPEGMMDDRRKPLAMTLILLKNLRHTAMQNHQI
jgi:hypothetical protein